ncbi:MAG TPA: hypothetical protein VGP68_03175 [Gemmataceae bacterium]|jgi:hypothetical protein|nr:hypothetical protein [Gemmataceae bacterium]
MKNFEWVVPVIVFTVFVIGNIMRILNWKNEQERKAAKRPREFQIPRRPSAVQPTRESEPPMVVEAVFPATVQRPMNQPVRPSRLESLQPSSRQRPQPAALPEEVQRAIRRNRAKAQKKEPIRAVVEERVVAVVAPATPRQTRDDVPNVPAVVLPEGGEPATSALAMSTVISDLFKSPESVARAMVLQVIFSPPLSRRR